MRAATLLLLLLLCACAPSVIPAFEAARDQALAKPGPAPPGWEPDAVITLSRALVDTSLERLLDVHGSVESELDAGVLRATPKLEVKSVVLGEARCADCLRIAATLGGHLQVHTPLGSIRAPVTAAVDLDAVFGLERTGGNWTLTLAPRTVHDIEANVAGTDFTPLTRQLGGWIEAAFTEADPLPIAQLGSSDLPIRALRVRPAMPHLVLELLTNTPDPQVVREPDQVPGNGWRLDLATDSLLDLARIASFRAEPLPRQIVAEPTSLYVDGRSFTLGLRLWRVKGRGWWRDYSVTGTLSVTGDDRIALTPERVEPVAHSRGAGWVDPLAALGQGVILKALERALSTSAPAIHRDKGKQLRTVVQIDAIDGRGAVIVAEGGLELKDGPGRR